MYLRIPSGKSTPYYYVGDGTKEVYCRVGNESAPATHNILMELTLKGTHQSFDALNSRIFFKDYNFTLFEATYRERVGSSIDNPRDYSSFGLLFDDNYVTFGGAMLADQHLVYNSRIFCTRWTGLSKTSLFEAKDDAEYEGNIIKLYGEGVAFVKRNSALMWRKTVAGRDEYPDYPMESVKEALVNAIVHRDYIIKGTEIHIDMYDDRTEIVSPGSMVDGRIIQDLDIRSVYSARRNPILCDVFSRMHFMERRGSGLQKIYDAYPEWKKPTFHSTPQVFIVTLPNLNYGKTISAEGELVDIKNDNGGEKSSVGGEKIIDTSKAVEVQNYILELLISNNKLTSIELSKAIGVSVRTIERNIQQLRTNGCIDRIGGAKGGTWEIVKDINKN